MKTDKTNIERSSVPPGVSIITRDLFQHTDPSESSCLVRCIKIYKYIKVTVTVLVNVPFEFSNKSNKFHCNKTITYSALIKYHGLDKAIWILLYFSIRM